MKFGVCAGPQFDEVLAEAGFDFIELNIQNHLKTLEEDAEFARKLERIRSCSIPAIAANCFLPSALKVTGPDADMFVLKSYITVALERAKQAGITTIIFGSGGARRIPDHCDRDVAWRQLVAFGSMAGSVAQQHDVTIAVEPLNQQECNVLTSVREAGEYVQQVGHENVALLVDAYHWLLDDNDEDAIVTYGHLLRHVHIATRDSRLPPGFEACDFSRFFHALKEAQYDGPISIEAQWNDITSQAATARVTLAELAGE